MDTDHPRLMRKEFTTNADQIETELEAWEPFLVSPSPDSQIGLYSEFEVRLKTIIFQQPMLKGKKMPGGKKPIVSQQP